MNNDTIKNIIDMQLNIIKMVMELNVAQAKIVRDAGIAQSATATATVASAERPKTSYMIGIGYGYVAHVNILSTSGEHIDDCLLYDTYKRIELVDKVFEAFKLMKKNNNKTQGE